MSFKTRIHPSPYTATIPSLVVKQWPKFRRLGLHRRLGEAMLPILPAMCCLSLIFTLHGGAGDDGRPSPERSRGFAGSLNGRPKMEVPQNEFPPTTSSPTARTWGGSSLTQVSASHRSAREAKKGCVPRPFAVGYASHPDDPSSPEAAEKDELRTMALMPMGSWTQASKSHLRRTWIPCSVDPASCGRGSRRKSLHARSACGLRMQTPCRDPAHRIRREEESGMPAGLPGSHRG